MTGAPRLARRRPAGLRSRISRSPAAGPFAALGLEATADVTDDDVRAAWRRVAAATHPDRADGGDPEQFAAAAAAYTSLRTRFGRGEVLADLRATPADTRAVGRPARFAAPGRPARAAAPGRPARAAAPGRPARAAAAGAARRLAFRVRRGRPARAAAAGAARRLAFRVRRGRPWRLALRFLAVASASGATAAAAGAQPATPALITGAMTWLVLTARHDLAPGAGGQRAPAPAGDHDLPAATTDHDLPAATTDHDLAPPAGH